MTTMREHPRSDQSRRNSGHHRPRRPTLRDVAEEAGVSFKTVSRVVNGESGVSATRVALVEAAIDRLGYRPDQRARQLRQGSTSTGVIGFVMVDVANPFFSSILRGIEEVARERHCLVLAGSTDGLQRREDQLVEAFVARRVDGLIVVPSSDRSKPLATEMGRGTPVVFLDIEPGDADVDLVRSDHRGGAELATRHLIEHGHHDIAFFGDEDRIYSARLRREGFHHAMTQAGLVTRPQRVIAASSTAEAWRRQVLAYLAEPDGRPTAIISGQNLATIGTAQALHHLGLHTSIAQIGFDDVELADVVEPGLSVVPQQPARLGHLAAEILFDRLDGDRDAPRRIILGGKVVARGSGELPPPPGRRTDQFTMTDST